MTNRDLSAWAANKRMKLAALVAAAAGSLRSPAATFLMRRSLFAARWADRIEACMRTPRPAFRAQLVVAVCLFLHPVHSSAQSTVETIQPSTALAVEGKYQAKAVGWAAVRFEAGAPAESRAASLMLALVRSSHGVGARNGRLPDAARHGRLKRAVSWELTSTYLSGALPDAALLRVRQPGQQRRSWIRRHPVLFGTLMGFGAGFLVGYLPGDDGVFDDFTAEFNGLVLGGIGAGVGALVGAAASK